MPMISADILCGMVIIINVYTALEPLQDYNNSVVNI